MNKQQKQWKSTRQIVLVALFIALSAAGALIKVPSPTGTVALDALPAFLATLLLGGFPGAIVGFLGHMASAVTAGFPLTIPIHLLVGALMAVIMLICGVIARKIHPVAAMAAGIVLNGVGAPAAFILIPKFGMVFFTSMVLPLTVGSAINIIIAGILYYSLRKTKIVKSWQETRNGKQEA